MTLTSFLALFWQRSQENKLTQAAGSLTYSTMLAIVPLIMVVFSIFSAFPVFNEVTGALKEFIFTNFAPSASDVVGQYIDEFVRNSKQMSAVGIVSLILVALMLINSIDRTPVSYTHLDVYKRQGKRISRMRTNARKLFPFHHFKTSKSWQCLELFACE